MTSKKYTLSLNGLPDHEHIIFKLICSVSERTKNRSIMYTLNNDTTAMSDIYINDILNKASLDERSSFPVNVWISSNHNNHDNTITRPLIASRVLNILDNIVNTCSNLSEKKPATNTLETDERTTIDTSIDFNISEEEASELAIVHDEILENPSNHDDPASTNEPSMKNPGLTLINGKSAALINNSKKLSTPQVLVVDDSASVRKQLEIELEFFNASVDYAESAESAFNLLKIKKYDVVLLDVVLPDKDGFQICKYIKAEDKSTVAIMLTGKATQTDKIKGSLAGCNAYLVKPVGRQTFQSTIKNYLPFKINKTAVKA